MKYIFVSFITGLFGAALLGATAFFGIYYLLSILPLNIDLDNERTFFMVLYSFIAAVIVATVAGAITGVIFGRRYKQ